MLVSAGLCLLDQQNVLKTQQMTSIMPTETLIYVKIIVKSLVWANTDGSLYEGLFICIVLKS